MSEADFKTIHLDPRVQTPPPRVYLSTLAPGKSLGVQPPADGMRALAPETTAPDQVRTEEVQHLSTAAPGENGEADRFARWLEQKGMEQDNRYNRTVTISPLPDDATVADVLPRIRGGVDSCYVSQFGETRVAVVTFKLAADAITYADFCAETPIWGLWTFQISRPGVPFTWERRAKVQLYKAAAPEMGKDIPTGSRAVVLAGSRCLVYKGCKPHEVAIIYRALGLQYSQHQRDQVEGMWLEGPMRDHNGDPVRGNLHVWYTSIKAAQEARVRVTSLEFEYDPCSDSPDKLLLYLDEGDEVPIFRHHEPFVNLIELDQKSILTGIYEGLVDPVQAYWRCHATSRPAMPDPMADLTARLQWSLQTNNGPATMSSTMPGAYQQSDVVLAPAALSDPFLDTQPIATGIKAQRYNRATTSYPLAPVDQTIPTEYQPFGASRAFPPGHHLSPLETYVARTQERRALGLPPHYSTNKNDVAYDTIQPSSSLIGGANNTSGGIGVIGDSARRSTNPDTTTNRYSNLGGGDDDTRTNLTDAPQDIQVPGDSAHTNVHDTSPVSDSSFLSAASPRAILHDNAGNSGKQISTYISGTDSDSFPGSTGVKLRGGKVTESDMVTAMNTDGPVDVTDSKSSTAPGKYSRKDLDTQDIFWTCSLEEFRAMSDKQWASFGTAFYVAPAGFDTATKHVVRLE